MCVCVRSARRHGPRSWSAFDSAESDGGGNDLDERCRIGLSSMSARDCRDSFADRVFCGGRPVDFLVTSAPGRTLYRYSETCIARFRNARPGIRRWFRAEWEWMFFAVHLCAAHVYFSCQMDLKNALDRTQISNTPSVPFSLFLRVHARMIRFRRR